MSKNFELLQRLSKEQGMFDTGIELSPIPPLPDACQPLQRESEGKPVELIPPKLEMEEKQRDEIMKFVQQVFLMPRAEAPRTVVFTGTESGNGCSWICCRAAEILASQVRAPICVVDANLRSLGLHHFFGVENHHGLSDGRTKVRIESVALSGDPMRLRLTELRQYFEYVLVDAPPLTVGSEAMRLGRSTEGVILVLKANASRRDSVRKAVQDLQNAGVRVLGAVLNQRTYPIPEAIYTRL